jgi:hypothetical protein
MRCALPRTADSTAGSALASTVQAPKRGKAVPASGVFYAQYPLTRAEHVRPDAQQLAALLSSQAARLLLLSGSKVLVTPAAPADGAPTADAKLLRPVWVQPAGDAAALLDPAVAPIFLGLDQGGVPHFAGGVMLLALHAARDTTRQALPRMLLL